MNNKRASLLITSILIASVFFATPAVYAADARVYISAVSPSKSGYAVDEAVTINTKIKWEDLTANKTIELQLWNATDLIESLENYTIPYNVSSTLTPDGSYTASYSPTADLTEEEGSKTYYLKLLGSDDLTIDSEQLTILVADEDVGISVVWQDSNNDRTVEKNEGIVWTVYTTWGFVETTESHSLYVDWGTGTEELLDTISVTAGTGDDTSTKTKGFDSEGTKTIVFKLKDTTGSVVASQTVTLKVGTTSTTPDTTSTSQTSAVAWAIDNAAYIGIGIAVVVVGYFLLKKKEDK